MHLHLILKYFTSNKCVSSTQNSNEKFSGHILHILIRIHSNF